MNKRIFEMAAGLLSEEETIEFMKELIPRTMEYFDWIKGKRTKAYRMIEENHEIRPPKVVWDAIHETLHCPLKELGMEDDLYIELFTLLSPMLKTLYYQGLIDGANVVFKARGDKGDQK